LTPEQKITWSIVAVVTVGVAVLLVVPKVEQRLAPEPVGAWVAIEPAGAGVAEIGRVELAAGTDFRLHAVVEARGRDGAAVYYTEAPALAIDGRRLDAGSVRRWDRPGEIKVLWFTVEGASPYLALDAGEELDRFRFEPFFRPEWGFGWSVPGVLEPAHDDRLAPESRLPRLPCGSPRYQVRVETYARERVPVPATRLASPIAAGPDQAADGGAATVVAALPGAAGPSSAAFGLTQIELPPDAGEAARQRLVRWTAEQVAFGRVTLLGAVIEAAGLSPGALGWRQVPLDGGIAWGEGGAAPGDLVRVGDRVVVLYLDQGEQGALDRDDLCFDYVRGAAVRPLSAVFAPPSGGGVGEVEWAPLAASRSQ
jgi:hypothetical protein